MAILILSALLSSLAVVAIISYFIYRTAVDDVSDGWIGLAAIMFLLLAVFCWTAVAKYNESTLEDVIEDAVSVQIDTTFIVSSNKIDTLYTINYEKVNKYSQEYEKSK